MGSKQWKDAHPEQVKLYRRVWYARHREYSIKKTSERRQQIQSWWNKYKLQFKCSQCGESHPAVLEFHHQDPPVKEINLSEIAWRGWGIQRILKEIEKCIVLCANHHKILHWKEKRKG